MLTKNTPNIKKILLLSCSLLLLLGCKKEENTTTVFDNTYWKGSFLPRPVWMKPHGIKLIFATNGLCTFYILDTLTGKYTTGLLKFSVDGKKVTLTKAGTIFQNLRQGTLKEDPGLEYTHRTILINEGICPVDSAGLMCRPLYLTKYNLDESIDESETF